MRIRSCKIESQIDFGSLSQYSFGQVYVSASLYVQAQPSRMPLVGYTVFTWLNAAMYATTVSINTAAIISVPCYT